MSRRDEFGQDHQHYAAMDPDGFYDFEDAETPSRNAYDQRFERAFGRARVRRLPHALKIAKQQALRDAGSSDDMELARLAHRTQGRLVDSGFDESTAGTTMPAYDQGEQDDILAQLEQVNAQLAALSGQQEPPAPMESLPMTQHTEGDSLPDLASLDVILGNSPAAPEPAPTPEPAMPAKEQRAYMPPAQTVDHGTPMVIVRALLRMWGDIDLDPCASQRYLTVPARMRYFGTHVGDRDGLREFWVGRTYFNPPYGRAIGEWLEKAVAEFGSGECRSVGLLPLRGAQWFTDLILDQATAICFVRGRLTFEGSSHPAPFNSILPLFADEDFDAFKKAFETDKDEVTGKTIGKVYDLRKARG